MGFISCLSYYIYVFETSTNISSLFLATYMLTWLIDQRVFIYDWILVPQYPEVVGVYQLYLTVQVRIGDYDAQ